MVERLERWDLDTRMEPCGYDMESVPDLSVDNMRLVIEKLNELIDAFNEAERERRND